VVVVVKDGRQAGGRMGKGLTNVNGHGRMGLSPVVGAREWKESRYEQSHN